VPIYRIAKRADRGAPYDYVYIESTARAANDVPVPHEIGVRREPDGTTEAYYRGPREPVVLAALALAFLAGVAYADHAQSTRYGRHR